MSAGDFVKVKDLNGLNPCCNGIYSMSVHAVIRVKNMQRGLNPCCNGIYSMRWQQNHSESQLRSLNPCCNGIYSMRAPTYMFNQHANVLILVVMEYTQ